MDENRDSIVALRSAHQHQVQLTMLADQKANINIGFISVLAIFLSRSPLIEGIQDDLLLKIGFVLFALFLSLALVMALMVVMPRLGRKKISNVSEMTNPFYFGMFTQISQDEYLEHIAEKLTSDEKARQMLASDVYQIGQVLNKKYRSLRISYIFLGLSIFTGLLLYCYLVFSGSA